LPEASDTGMLQLAELLTKPHTFPCRIAKETLSPLFRTPVQLSPSQIVDAIRAAGDSAETMTATDSHVEGRFMRELREYFVVNAPQPHTPEHQRGPSDLCHPIDPTLTGKAGKPAAQLWFTGDLR
jgi:hypothetical protein